MKKRYIFLLVLVLIALIITVVATDPSSTPDKATALTPCGADPTPELAATCQREVQRANDAYHEKALSRYADSLQQ